MPEYDEAILETQEAFVMSFPRGELIEVESSHYMEGDVAGVIVEELRVLIARAD